MITKEVIEAACAVLNERDKGNAINIPDVVAMLTAAFAAMPGPVVNDFALPQDVIDSLIAIGPVEWGVSLTQSDEKHAADLMDTLRITREHFGMTDEETGIHGVYLSGTGVVLAHTGMSPNSPQHARILTGAWNMLVDHANSAPTTPSTDIASENERLRAALEKVVDWASRRCPADDESVPCPLCGARADIPGDFCKSVESIFPRDLLRDTRAALERT